MNKYYFQGVDLLESDLQLDIVPVQVCRVCDKQVHSVYGLIDLTPEILTELVTNFDEGAYGLLDDNLNPTAPIDYFHRDYDIAAGWIHKLYTKGRGKGMTLWADVEFTAAARTKIRNKELRYFSPAIHHKYINTATGKEYSNVFGGGGLTNIPFLHNMRVVAASRDIPIADKPSLFKHCLSDLKVDDDAESPIIAIMDVINAMDDDESKLQIALLIIKQLGGTMDTATQDNNPTKASNRVQPKVKPEVTNLSSAEESNLHSTEVGPVTSTEGSSETSQTKLMLTQLDAMVKALQASQSAVTELTARIANLESGMSARTKEQEFKALLLSGKVVPSQKEAYITGDMAKFIELNRVDEYHLEATGGIEEDVDGQRTQPEVELEAQITKLMTDHKVSYIEAAREVIYDPKYKALLSRTGRE